MRESTMRARGGPAAPLASVRRRPLAGLLVAALAASWGCGGGAGGRTPLVIYSPHGRDLLSFFEKRFEASHPGVDVQWIDMGSQEVLDRLRSEKANPQADVWWGAPTEMFERGAAEGLLAPSSPTWADDLPTYARDSTGLWYGTYRTPEVIAYNSDALTRAQAPQDWDDLLAPKWRGKVLIRDPLASGTMHAIFGAIMWRQYQRTGDSTAGYKWLLRLDAQTRDYVLNPTLLYQKLARQEGLVTVWDMPDVETLRATTKLPIDYLIPKSGTPVVIDAIAVVKGAKHPALARTFLQWAGSEPELLAAARHFYRIPARTDIPADSLPDWLRRTLPDIRPMKIDRAYVREHLPGWLQYWDRNIRDRGRDEGY